jgi:hypothetical protein
MEDTDEQMQAARREKQMFLKSEIIEEGYDPQAFSEYMDSLKEDGT